MKMFVFWVKFQWIFFLKDQVDNKSVMLTKMNVASLGLNELNTAYKN